VATGTKTARQEILSGGGVLIESETMAKRNEI